MPNKLYNADFTAEELKKALAPRLLNDKKQILLNMLIACLAEDSNSMSQLSKALLGIAPNIEYSVGDQVVVNVSGLSSWKFDLPHMREKGVIDSTSFDEDTRVDG